MKDNQNDAFHNEKIENETNDSDEYWNEYWNEVIPEDENIFDDFICPYCTRPINYFESEVFEGIICCFECYKRKMELSGKSDYVCDEKYNWYDRYGTYKDKNEQYLNYKFKKYIETTRLGHCSDKQPSPRGWLKD